MAPLVNSIKESKINNTNNFKFFQKIEEGTLYNFFYETRIALILKPNNHTAKRKKGRKLIVYECKRKNSQ